VSGAKGGLLNGFADEADRFVEARLERLAESAREKTDQLAEHAGERFARHFVDELMQRLAAKLAWAAAAAGALVVAVCLIIVGLAGALGEVFGRPWLGQLGAGVATLLVAIVAGAIARARKRRSDEWEKTRAALEEVRAAAESESEDSEDDGDEDGAGDLGRQAVKAGTEFLRRHPVAGAVAISAAGLLASSIIARSNGRSRSEDEDEE